MKSLSFDVRTVKDEGLCSGAQVIVYTTSFDLGEGAAVQIHILSRDRA